jgi:NitT/TauT family transport system permease protein
VNWKSALTPNEVLTPRSVWAIVAAWIILLLGYWTAFKPDIFPSPVEVFQAFPTLWFRDGLGQELISSFYVNLEALLLSAAVSLPLAYLCRVPLSQPLATFVAKLRFLSPGVFFVPLLFLASGAHQVKVLMLTLGETFFLVTTMVGVVQAIPAAQYDDASTLRMSEWAALWYVNVRGTLAQVFDAIRDNAAMGWSMLIMVEGFVRSEGGVGVLLINQEKHVNFAEVYAVAIAIVLVGIAQDYIIGVLKSMACPWAVKRG